MGSVGRGCRKKNCVLEFLAKIFVQVASALLNGEKILGSFYEKELLRSILKMSYYLELGSHIRDKVKVALGLIRSCYR